MFDSMVLSFDVSVSSKNISSWNPPPTESVEPEKVLHPILTEVQALEPVSTVPNWNPFVFIVELEPFHRPLIR